METKAKRKIKTSKLMIIIICCAVVFALFLTMLIDFILISFSAFPIFTKIASTSESDDEYTYIAGHGILYTIAEKRWEIKNGYFAGYKFFFGYKKLDKDIDIKINYEKFHKTQKDTVIVNPPHGPHDEYVIDDNDVLNMDVVRRLAYGDINPFEFMGKYTGTLIGDDPITYFVVLPNEYVVRIEYSDNTINYIHLEDHRLDKYIDLDMLEIDAFLNQRGE